MNAEISLQDRIHTILAALTTVPSDEISDGDRLREDLGMDSVASMELLSMLAEELGIEVEMEEAVDVATVGHVVALAKRHLDAR